MTIMYPFGYSGQMIDLPTIKLTKTFRLLDSEVANRIEALMVLCRGEVGIGQGWRDPVADDAEFIRRHFIDDAHGTITFNGHRWSLRPGFAPIAPSDRSYHCIGMAADLVGNLKLAYTHEDDCGLRDFRNVGTNPEGWHFQPVEIPASRSQYDPRKYQPLKHLSPVPITPPGPTPAPPPSEEDEPMQQIRVEGDPAVFLRAGLECTWVASEDVQNALVNDGFIPAGLPKIVSRQSLKALVLRGPLPGTATQASDFAAWIQ